MPLRDRAAEAAVAETEVAKGADVGADVEADKARRGRRVAPDLQVVLLVQPLGLKDNPELCLHWDWLS